MRKSIKFGRLPVGAKFWEKKDKYGRAFTFPLIKIRPEIVNGEKVTARAGAAKMQFDDSELVEID